MPCMVPGAKWALHSSDYSCIVSLYSYTHASETKSQFRKRYSKETNDEQEKLQCKNHFAQKKFSEQVQGRQTIPRFSDIRQNVVGNQ